MEKKKEYTFIDLFAGLGGFHYALHKLGHKCVFASELREDLQKLYKQNFPDTPRIEGDITKIDLKSIPHHDILCAGFPCQPFSQAGKRMGFDDEEGRGNMFNYICKIIQLQKNKPIILLLENVANLRGHDDGNTWRIIQEKLDKLGYSVRGEILSPHQFGIPQHRKRFYIVGLRKDKGDLDFFQFPIGHQETECDIKQIIDESDTNVQPLKLETIQQIKVWQEFVDMVVKHKDVIPSFPIWAMEFGADYDFKVCAPKYQKYEDLKGKHGNFGQIIDGKTIDECIKQLPIYSQTGKKEIFPHWKIRYIEQNRLFYQSHKKWLDKWLLNIRDWNNSHQKFEWNCGDSDKNLRNKIIQFRPSGIRVKLPTFSPALNLVGTQIPIIPWVKLPKECIPHYSKEELMEYGLKQSDVLYGRYLTVREAAKLQGMGELDFNGMTTVRIYEALGNAVNTQVVEKIASKILNHYNHGSN